MEALQDPHSPLLLKQIALWVIGEYAHVTADLDAMVVIDTILDFMEGSESDSMTMGYAITCLGKV